MRKDMMRSPSRGERQMPSRRLGFFSPWFDDEDFFTRDFFGDDAGSSMLSPAIDVEEAADEYIVTADLPGVKKENISIECTDNQLTIKAERKSETGEGKRADRRERFYGTYLRSFTLPSGVDSEKINASYEGGVLTLKVPKAEQAKSRKIQIGGGS